MHCRNCGAEIADKALICYRCGTATADAKYKPAAIQRRRLRRSHLVLLVLIVAVLLLVALYVLRSSVR